MHVEQNQMPFNLAMRNLDPSEALTQERLAGYLQGLSQSNFNEYKSKIDGILDFARQAKLSVEERIDLVTGLSRAAAEPFISKGCSLEFGVVCAKVACELLVADDSGQPIPWEGSDPDSLKAAKINFLSAQNYYVDKALQYATQDEIAHNYFEGARACFCAINHPFAKLWWSGA